MSTFQEKILRTKIEEAQVHWKRLDDKANMMNKARDGETRVEEKVRMAAIIEETEKEREQLETELNALVTPAARVQPPNPTPETMPAPVPTSSREPTAKPIELFYSYSYHDKALHERLDVHLKILERQGIISGWHDREIKPGAEWEDEIDARLESAGIILLLISADFIAFDSVTAKC